MPDPESQLLEEDQQAVHHEHKGALEWMPWWLPMWVPIVTVCGVLAIGAVMYLVLVSPLGLWQVA
jgi:hypothetical protein